MIKIRLQRHGARHAPFYRMVVAPSTSRRDGRFIEVLGTYDPQSHSRAEELKLKMDRIDHWLQVGAQPTDTAKSLIRQGRLSPEDWLERAEKKTKAKADRKNNKKPALEASAVDQEDAKTEDSEPEAKSEEAEVKEPEAEVKEEQKPESEEEAKTEDSEPEAKSENADAKEPEAEVKEEQQPESEEEAKTENSEPEAKSEEVNAKQSEPEVKEEKKPDTKESNSKETKKDSSGDDEQEEKEES